MPIIKLSVITQRVILWMLGGVLAFSGTGLLAGTLLRNNFESDSWAGKSVYSNNVAVTPSLAYDNYGTIDTFGGSTGSLGLLFSVNSSAAGGPWTAGFTSGILNLTTVNTTVTNLGLVTLSFKLKTSSVHPVGVIIESYDASNLRTGGLRTLINPATTNYYQRFAIDLSTMTPTGAGVFDPTSPNIAVSFEMDSAAGGNGWPNASGLSLQIDNLNYATPKYYVKTTGVNTSGGGLTEATAFATPGYATGKAVAGDIIVVAGGSYVGSSVSFGATAVGAPDAWIVLKNYPGQTPVIQYGIWNAIFIGFTGAGASPQYIEVRGLTVRGYSGIDTNGDRYLDPGYTNGIGLVVGNSNGNGLSIDDRQQTTEKVHDIRFADNIIEYNSGGGIGVNGDRILIENNISRNNAWWMIYAASGISMFNTDYENNSDCRNVIQNNQTYGNETMVPWMSQNKFSDGNGIILDVSLPYKGFTLVQNNLSYNNGGSGMHSFEHPNVRFAHNTIYDNSASPKLTYAQISGGYTSNVWIFNNVIVAPPNITGDSAFNESVTANGNNLAGTIFFQNNLYWGGQVAIPSNGQFINNTQADPQFISPSINPANASFLLRSNSPAINNGVALDYRSGVDLNGQLRLPGVVDQGAYETQTNYCFPPVFSPLPGNYSTATNVTLACGTPGAKIIFTTNGTTPIVGPDGTVMNGFTYASAFPFSSATTLTAIAWKTNLVTSMVTSGGYTFFDRSSIPIPDLFFVYALMGSSGSQSVAAVCRTPGALERYTLDGSAPTPTTGTLAGQSLISLSGNQTLRMIAYLPGRANSAIANLAGFSMFNNATPAAGTATNVGALEVGNRFRSSVNGTITALRVWCPAGSASSFIARLWQASGTGAGTSLGSVTIKAVANGWAGAAFGTPVNILANTDYIVSYSVAASTAYKAAANGLASSRTNGALYFPAGNNGVYATSSGAYPTLNSGGTDYGADVFMVSTPAASPVFNPPPGIYTGSQFITLTSLTPGAVIYYTTNNTTPTPASPSVASGGAIWLNTNTTVQAMAVAAGSINSYVTSGSYVIVATNGPTQQLLAINAAGPAIGGSTFAADTGFTAGALTSTTSNINLTLAINPAPMAVYQTERYGTNFGYILNGLPPTNACLVRLHFSENWEGTGGRPGGPGRRYFNIAVNGTQRLTNFDITAEAGAPNTAVVIELATVADASGQVLVNFTSGVGSPDNNALVDGLEVYTVTPFDAWRVANFTPAQLDNLNISGATADPDGDGMNNFVEYALGTNPNVVSMTGQPTGGTDGSGHATITFFRAASDVTYIVEGANSLSSPVIWSGIATNPPSVGQAVTVTDNVPANTSPRFLRVKFVP